MFGADCLVIVLFALHLATIAGVILCPERKRSHCP